MGYGRQMIQELEQTINSAEADLVIVGTPIDLGRFLKINKPVQRARYELQEIGRPTLADVLKARLTGSPGQTRRPEPDRPDPRL
jgi:predicted GTPase